MLEAPARPRRRLLGVVALLVVALLGAASYLLLRPDAIPLGRTDPRGGPRVLVFTKVAAYGHASIPDAVAALRQLGDEHGFAVDDTRDATRFTTTELARYAAVVWVSTTGDVLDDAEQDAFRAYVEGGGGFVGVHAAGHGEQGWDWYGTLVGARFAGTDQSVQDGVVHVEDHEHPSTAGLPDDWPRKDEWYDFTPNPRGAVHVLATLDESTVHGTHMGADHPIAWCHDVGAGRSWYTAGGHTKASYADPLFREHLLGGVLWAAGLAPGDCSTPTPVS